MKTNVLNNKFLVKISNWFSKFNVNQYKDEKLEELKNNIKIAKHKKTEFLKASNNLDENIKQEKLNIINLEIEKRNNELNEYKGTLEYSKKKNLKSVAYKDLGRSLNSILFACLTIGLLIWIVVYIFATGAGKLTINKIFGNYKSTTYSLKTTDDFALSDDLDFSDIDLESENTSKKRGVEFEYQKVDDKQFVAIKDVSDNSPFKYLVNVKDNSLFSETYNDLYIQSITLLDDNNYMYTAIGDHTIQEFIKELDAGTKIIDSTLLGEGGGFRGSLLNTLSLIGLSLLFAFPLGVGAAIYLGVYAKDNKLTKIVRTLIDTTSGIPSIIFGLAGALIFIPIANLVPGSNGGNLISGALTMTMILLPTIVKTVEESIKVIPKSLTNASLALGASRTETVFKVVVPNALPGMLTSLLLSIGRIIGESAALVFAMGTTISEVASMNGSNASLAVHIWVILGGDHPAYDNACAISIVIIVIVLVLTLLIKLISYKLNKFKA